MANNLSNYSEPPRNWKDLQNKTARIFSELGYNTDVEKKIKTVRGKVEVDVVAEQQIPIRLKIFCECKQWSKKVPQTVIHAFQTVVQNSSRRGAGRGSN